MMAKGSSSVRERVTQMSVLPRILATAGGVLCLLAVAQAVFSLRIGSSFLGLVIDFLLLSLPGVALVYTGFWMPVSEIERRYYPRVVAWLLGGVVVMFGFIVLRDLHPNVTVEWSLGTQAIALTIGSIGGLLIGVQETRATMRAEQLERQTRRLEEYTDRLERREQELERQNDQLDRFASVVSHDLRNPLNVAQGRLEFVRDGADDEHVEAIERALDRMNELIDDLLVLARAGDQVSEVETVDLAELFAECWRTVDTAEATFRTAGDRRVRADRSRLTQLLENLVRNAVEHGGEDVTVTLGAMADGFYVEDSGPGIPEDERDEVFDTGYSTAAGGTGFGLSIVRQVADAHDWDVRVTEGTDGGVPDERIESGAREPSSPGARFEFTGVDCVE